MNILTLYNWLIKIILFGLTFIVVFKIGAFYGSYADPGQDAITFFQSDHKIQLTKSGDIPQDIQLQIDDYNKGIVPFIWYTILAIFLYSLPGIYKKYKNKKFKINLEGS